MSCPRDVGATQRCVSLTSLRGRAPAFSRFGRWWRNPRLVVRPSGVGVAMVEHVVSHVFEIAIPRRASSTRGVCAIRGEAGEMARCDRDVGAVISALLAVNARPSGRVARVQLLAGARPSERSPTRRARGHAQVCRDGRQAFSKYTAPTMSSHRRGRRNTMMNERPAGISFVSELWASMREREKHEVSVELDSGTQPAAIHSTNV
jgi:hypothetical protein